MIECLIVLMLKWLARSNYSNNQAIRQSSNLKGVDFGAAGGEVGCGEGYEDEDEFGDGEVVVVVVEEYVDGDVEQYAHHDAHDEALEQFVGREEVDIAEGAEGGHDGEKGEEAEGTPEAVMIVDEKADEDECDGDVVEYDAIE